MNGRATKPSSQHNTMICYVYTIMFNARMNLIFTNSPFFDAQLERHVIVLLKIAGDTHENS